MRQRAIANTGPAGIAIAGPPDAREAYRHRQRRAFAAARRHSRLVLILRSAIPAACVIAVAGIALFTVFDPFTPISTITAVSTEGITGSQITMRLPKLSGFKKDLRSYDVTADSAVQDVKRPTVMSLTLPDAKIEIEKDKFARITSATGTYDSSTEKMRLEGRVAVKSDAGYDMELADANVDLKAGSIETSHPVRVKLTNGTIDAETMEVQDSGRIVFFRGHVTTLLDGVDPGKAGAAAPDEESAAETTSGGAKP